MLYKKKIAFLGAGSMAEAMISGIVNSEKVPAKQVIATNRSNVGRLKELEKKYGISVSQRDKVNLKEVDIIILAMKPKDIDQALLSIKNEINPNALILSVLAGITTSYMEQHLQEGQPVIRVMPNTSSMIGESATAISSGTQTSFEQVKLTKELLQTIGEVFVISEEKMDIFTGIAGSGPAYFYYLMEHMEKAGAENGLDPETSRQIIAQTIVGAAKMIQEQNETPTVLRENVTSPNGTTAAGLKALELNGGGNAIAEAVRSAAARSMEISAQLQGESSSKKKQVI
ncbi:pyrroline-5-carboxylate reductase [Litchfieldia salsa]|uniref:Pyrroline-5-carboxylate reductase n=1 Tax=Litchfieldia salsa TaxID=930152 RepID=A0A1H0WYK2_9BACI|nr:pyrroline-5-carboxylate reductase [Litchfieldia salsa]SDP95771.1 pyrroline-5-carboxylate reductase [Litchfieldia salsa]